MSNALDSSEDYLIDDDAGDICFEPDDECDWFKGWDYQD